MIDQPGDMYMLKKMGLKKRQTNAGSFKKGDAPWNKGLKGYMKGHKSFVGNNCGVNNAFYGKNHSEETKKRMKESALKRFEIKKNHPRWLGGKSFELYGINFNENLKERIRIRDNHICQFCFKKQSREKLCIHHIDYNKLNNSEFNLISLCRNCHIKTNSNRELWFKYFKFLMLSKKLLSERIKSEVIYNVK